MTIERTDKRKERFWTVSLICVAILLILFYVLLHSSTLFRLLLTRLFGGEYSLTSHEAFIRKALRFLAYGNDLLWGSGIVLALSYLFRKSKEQLKTGFLIALIFEAGLLLLVPATGHGMPDPVTCATVLAGNGLSFLGVLLHERILI
ncbi:MAG: hypothetical protein IJM50_01660 [Lachnospiraceae bacterium]|nr:hypothetical protein [Lachnospiraceae bacterium]